MAATILGCKCCLVHNAADDSGLGNAGLITMLLAGFALVFGLRDSGADDVSPKLLRSPLPVVHGGPSGTNLALFDVRAVTGQPAIRE